MYINNYRGIVNDRPLDTMVAGPASEQNSLNNFPAVSKPNYMDHVLRHMNNHNTIPVAELPTYDKGWVCHKQC